MRKRESVEMSKKLFCMAFFIFFICLSRVFCEEYSSQMAYTPRCRHPFTPCDRDYVYQIGLNHLKKCQMDMTKIKECCLGIEDKNFVEYIEKNLISKSVDDISNIGTIIKVLEHMRIEVNSFTEEWKTLEYYLHWALWHLRAHQYYQNVITSHSFQAEGCPTYDPFWLPDH
jgi:hypothetical protein